MFRSMKLDGVYPRVLQEKLVHTVVRYPSHFGCLGEVSEGYRKAKNLSVFEENKKDSLGTTFTSNPGKTMEREFLESISKHVKKEESAWI